MLFIALITITTTYFYGDLKRFLSPKKNYPISIGELPEGYLSHGIDISHYQGNIDWEAFSSDTNNIISYVYCKVTEGETIIDDFWKVNREKLKELNIPHGGYHFFHPNTDVSIQVKHFLNHYTPSQTDLPPVLDVETETNSDKKLIKAMKQWLTLFEEETGRRPVIYTSYHFYITKFKNEFNEYKFWIANYNKNVESKLEDENIIYWQYSDNGKVYGIEGPVDLNFSKLNIE